MKNYDPGLVIVHFNGQLITGFATGSMVEAERDEDAFKKSTGSQGDVVRVRNRNKGGFIKIRLQAESDSNATLSAQAKLDELAGAGAGVIQIENLNNETLCHATFAWVKKLPAIGWSDEATPREWLMDCAELDIDVTGATI